jgi:hypothetical protein
MRKIIVKFLEEQQILKKVFCEGATLGLISN